MVMGKLQNWHRRQAIILAGQLPDNTVDALIVLAAAKELVETFLAEDNGRLATMATNVLPFTN